MAACQLACWRFIGKSVLVCLLHGAAQQLLFLCAYLEQQLMLCVGVWHTVSTHSLSVRPVMTDQFSGMWCWDYTFCTDQMGSPVLDLWIFRSFAVVLCCITDCCQIICLNYLFICQICLTNTILTIFMGALWAQLAGAATRVLHVWRLETGLVNMAHDHVTGIGALPPAWGSALGKVKGSSCYLGYSFILCMYSVLQGAGWVLILSRRQYGALVVSVVEYIMGVLSVCVLSHALAPPR